VNELRAWLASLILPTKATGAFCGRVLICVGVLAACASGDDESAVAKQAFPKAVRSLLERRCLSCHNDVDQKGKFSLETRLAAFQDGYVVPRNSQQSHLVQLLESVDGNRPSMPKDGTPLTDADVRLIANWIDDGADWPDEVKLSQPVVDNFDWWSLRPLKRPAVPQLDEESKVAEWVMSPIDAFIARRLQQRQLTPSPPADRRTLIRRITYDLTGLPPTAVETEAYLADTSPDATRSLVERLLASPQYGERWGRHWLDVVQYADTCGYDKDKLRPNAWPYRDYIIRSFNDDKPYGRFIQEQIAGDVLFPGEPDGILGLGFIAAGPWDFIGHVEVPESKLDGKVARNLDRDDMVSNTLNTFCSATIQCARCHNHKFDPFTQEHYYNLQTIFAAIDRAERVYDIDPGVRSQRQQIKDSLTQVDSDLSAANDKITQLGGTDLVKLEAEIEQLQSALKPAAKRPEFGYHSQISPMQDVETWVEIDLGKIVKIQRVVLHPCHDDYAGMARDSGFRCDTVLKSA